jgi:hypothetical protein
VSQFVEECRREWKRLRVPSTIADEMANDLTADLEEAEADGASAEDVLGSGASDPRAFAAAWASERGIAQVPRSHRLRKRWVLLLVTPLVLCLIVIAGGALAFMSFGDSSAPRISAHVTPQQVVPGGVIGTSVAGAKVTPSGVALATGRRNVLHARPRSITITFGNSGGITVDVAHLTVSINRHTYRFTASHMLPGTSRSVRVAVPADVTSSFSVLAETQPVPGETNRTNNQAIWQIAVVK